MILLKFIFILTTLMLLHACGLIRIRPPQTYATVEQSNPINGGFGYNFGEVLDRSRVIQQSYTDNPKAQAYLVTPIVPNETTEHFNIEVCKRTNRIYSISGFTIYKNKDSAMRRLRAARQLIENKYGPLTTLPVRPNFYAEYVKYGHREIRLIATPGNFDPPKWGFSIMYMSDEHKHQCR